MLPAAAKTLGALGFKAYTSGNFPTRFCVYLFDPKFGHLQAILEADALGRYRTGAASAVATRKLARANATTLGMIGTGGQARTQLECIAKVRKLSLVEVYSRTAEHRDAFAQDMRETLGLNVVAVESGEVAVKNKDIVVTVTNSREPVLKGAWLAPGTHVNLVGSNYLARVEADLDVFRRAALVSVDNKEQAKIEAGNFTAPIREGVFGWTDVRELPHVLVGRYPGREHDDDITVFNSLGLGIEDIALGVKVLELARDHGAGRIILD
jgi:ornithine cyclodeaminase/alanine dehydrogenase-like protein (mu-crystallin family)